MLFIVLFLSLFYCRYSDALEQLFSYQRIPLEDLIKLEIGNHLISIFIYFFIYSMFFIYFLYFFKLSYYFISYFFQEVKVSILKISLSSCVFITSIAVQTVSFILSEQFKSDLRRNQKVSEANCLERIYCF